MVTMMIVMISDHLDMNTSPLLVLDKSLYDENRSIKDLI